MKVGDLTFSELRLLSAVPVTDAAAITSSPERMNRLERAGVVARTKILQPTTTDAIGVATAEVTDFGRAVAATCRCFLEDPLHTITELVDVLKIERDALRKEPQPCKPADS